MPSRKTVNVGQDWLTIENINQVADGNSSVEVRSGALAKVHRDFKAFNEFASKHEVYGVTTSLGDLLHKRMGKGRRVAVDVLLDHATGVGRPAPVQWVRAGMLVKVHQFCLGHSGVNATAVKSLVGLLDTRIAPVVPRFGSVGDGDIVPHAHIALVAVGKGHAFQGGHIVSGATALKRAGFKPVTLSKKDALSLINGTAYSTGIAALAITESSKILNGATAIAAAGFEVIEGNPESYSAQLTSLKNEASNEIARRLRRLLKGASYRRRRLQDPISFRCVPQVHGTALEILRWAKRLVEREANSISDNPIVVKGKALHGGNFYSSNVAIAADVLSQGLAYLGGISERRLQILLEGKYTGLPDYLSRYDGNVGMMIAQYSAAALTAKLRALATPYGVHSIPTSGLQEDFVPMTTNACIRLHECVETCRQIVAIEFTVVATALKMKERYGSEIAKRITSVKLGTELSKRFVQAEKLLSDGSFSRVD